VFSLVYLYSVIQISSSSDGHSRPLHRNLRMLFKTKQCCLRLKPYIAFSFVNLRQIMMTSAERTKRYRERYWIQTLQRERSCWGKEKKSKQQLSVSIRWPIGKVWGRFHCWLPWGRFLEDRQYMIAKISSL